MALTAAEKARVRDLTGWAAIFHELDRSMENALDAIATTPDDETRIRGHLTQLTDIDTRLTDARDRLMASAVGTITLNPAEISQLRAEGRRYVEAIASILRVQVKRNFYGGNSGGGWMAFG